MSEVGSLHYYPLTGARANSLEVMTVNNVGALCDRMFVLYDDTVNSNNVSARISQKQHPKLAQVGAKISEYADHLRINFPNQEQIVPFDEGIVVDRYVDEFGDLTPCIDCGDEAADAFAEFLDNDAVRLGQKVCSWLHGVSIEEASTRKAAPLHIVTSSSVVELQSRANSTQFGAERFRPNIVIQTDEDPFVENEWVGRVLKIGELSIEISGLTKRCPVPSYDQLTGENKKDIAKLYRDLAKSPEDNKPIFGVYGQPILEANSLKLIAKGDSAYIE